MTKIVALHSNGCAKFCFGCNKPFPVRKGRSDIQLGLDGQPYRHAMTPSPAWFLRSSQSRCGGLHRRRWRCSLAADLVQPRRRLHQFRQVLLRSATSIMVTSALADATRSAIEKSRPGGTREHLHLGKMPPQQRGERRAKRIRKDQKLAAALLVAHDHAIAFGAHRSGSCDPPRSTTF